MTHNAYTELKTKRIAEIKVDKVQQKMQRHQRTEVKRKREHDREVCYIAREWWMDEGD